MPKKHNNLYYNINLNVVKQQKRKKKPDNKKINNDIKNLIKVCGNATSVEEQISLIIKEISATPEFYKDVSEIFNAVTKILKKKWLGPFSLHLFGSVINELALKNSDVDIFIDFKGNLPLNGVEEIKSLLKNNKAFKRVIAIHAKVPIVQCIHQSEIVCDISFTSPIGIYSSNLVYFLFLMDDRLKPLFLIIKLLKKKKLSVEITSFCILLLLLYFVQQLQQPILPPICHIQNLANSKTMIDGWNVAFETNLSTLASIENKMTVPELLKAFFKFYSEFDFGLYVISPFMGKTYLKTVFANVNLLPDEFSCYKENLKSGLDCQFDFKKPVCIQSLFNHGDNISKNISNKNLLQFQKFCNLSFKAVENCDEIKNDSRLFFSKLLNNILSMDKKKLLVIDSSIIYPINIFDSGEAFTCADVILKWTEKIVDRLCDILKRILKCNVKPNPQFYYKKNPQDSVDGNTFCYIMCDFNKIILIKNIRKQFKALFSFAKALCPITKEEMVSDHLLLNNSNLINDENIQFNIDLSLMKCPTCVKIDFNCLEKSKSKIKLSEEVFLFIKKNLLPLLQTLV